MAVVVGFGLYAVSHGLAADTREPLFLGVPNPFPMVFDQSPWFVRKKERKSKR